MIAANVEAPGTCCRAMCRRRTASTRSRRKPSTPTAGIPQGVQAEPAAVVEGAPGRLHQAAEEDPRPPRCHAAGIGVAAQPEPGDLQPENHGHFGLALEAYAHFTRRSAVTPTCWCTVRSSMRCRQAVGQVHLQRARNGGLALQCSERERRADEAEREVDERYRAAWMEKHWGGQFDGQCVIRGVTSFGLFVESGRVQGAGPGACDPADAGLLQVRRHPQGR